MNTYAGPRPTPRSLHRAVSLIAAFALVVVTVAAAGPRSAAGVAPGAAAALPPTPAAWPSSNLELGLTDSPGGAAALHSSGAYKFRYQYLCAGVNTGTGWATWNTPAGKFADYYVDESVAVGITPVFVYYQLLQSKPGIDALTAGTMDEAHADLANLKNTATMKSYWADVRLMFQHLGAYSQTIVVDLEPDLWGYIQQGSTGDNAATVQAAVASSGDADVAGMANNATGFAKAFIKLRDKYAPNVLLGYELSMWGTLTDPLSQNIPLDQIDALAARSTAFQKSTGASFDLVFTDPADRDADFDRLINNDGGNSWWDSTDYDRFNKYVGDFVSGTGLRMVLWQIPLGNTKMRAMNNTWGHYQDNHVQWWLDDTTGHLNALINSGVVALLFGGGADGTTEAADDQSDGVTNPAAINGNTTLSYNSDDDGGYFRHRATAYYTAGAVPLPNAGPGASPTPTPSPTPPPTPGTYVAVTPFRILDTRTGKGLTGRFQAGQPRSLQIAGVGVIPGDAIAITGNLTVTRQSTGGYITLGPTVDPSPAYSTLNFPAKGNGANGVTVALSGGYIQAVYAGAPSGAATDLVLDITGYFEPTLTHAGFHALTPYRALDTRDVTTDTTGFFYSDTPRTFSVGAGVPSDAVAVTGNLTVTDQSTGGYLTLGPTVSKDPEFSTLNFEFKDRRANNVTVQLGDLGTLQAVFKGASGAHTNLVFDVTGYYGPGAGGASYVPIDPVRVVDTRYQIGLDGQLQNGSIQTFSLVDSVPAGTAAVSVNVTVVGLSSSGYVSVGPALTWPAGTSALNFPVNGTRANGQIVAITSDRTLSICLSGTTKQAVIDLSGYFVPIP